MLSAAGGLILATVLSLLPAADGTDPPFGQHGNPTPPPATGATAGGGQVQVQISTTGTTTSGAQISTGGYVPAPAPLCYRTQGKTGYDYYEYWKPGGPARQADTLDDFAYQGLLNPGYDTPDISTDHDGHWYDSYCSVGAPADVQGEFYRSHPSVYVHANEAPPADVAIDPETLARLAAESMVLPPGTVRWNPTLAGSGATIVGADTWVWVEEAPETVRVTASIDQATFATVEAHLTSIDVEAGGFADSDRCDGAGTPWSVGALPDAACILHFTRSTAGLAGPGQKLPTTTLTATAHWDAWWFSSYDLNAHNVLDIDPLVTTGDISVAEVQSIVTTG